MSLDIEALGRLESKLDDLIERSRRHDRKLSRLDPAERVTPAELLRAFELVVRALDGELERGLPGRPLEESCSFDHAVLSTNADARELASTCLRTQGVVVLRGCVPRPEAARLGKQVAGFVTDHAEEIRARTYLEFDRYVVDGRGNHLKGYKRKAKMPKAVVNVRGGADNGLVDFFNVGHLFPDLEASLTERMCSSLVSEIIESALSARATFANLNVYYNHGIQKTRGFHVDAYDPRVKVFLYLSDAREPETGPYCYGLGSHRAPEFQAVNEALAAELHRKPTDVLVLDPACTRFVGGDAGDVVISCQHGAHRGYPQAPDATRILAVQSVNLRL